MSNSSQRINLHDLNASKVSVHIPAIIYISIMMVTGSVGNFLVILVFGFRIKKRSSYRLFVLAMAIYDMVACCLAMPGLLVDMLNPFMFYSSVGCKILRYGYHVIAFSTSLTHMLLGLDRYRRICKPLHKQITISCTRRVLFIQFFAAFVVAVPSVLMYDSSTVDTGTKDIVGRQCGISDSFSDTMYPVLYESFLSIVVVATVVLLVVCYILIGRELYRRSIFLNSLKKQVVFNIPGSEAINNDIIPKVKLARRMFKNKIKPDYSVIEEDLLSLPESSTAVNINACNKQVDLSEVINHNVTHEQRDRSEVTNHNEAYEQRDYNEVTHHNEACEQRDLNEVTNQNKAYEQRDYNGACPETNREMRSTGVLKTTQQVRIRKKAVRELVSRRLTAVTFTITLFFIISYFPLLVCQFLTMSITDFVNNMPISGEATYTICMYSYALNNVVNPVVYLAMDTEFRSHSKAIVCSVRDKLRQK